MSKLKHVTETVDRETGEFLTTQKTFAVKATSENFYMTFINAHAGLLGITHMTDRHVLDCLCMMSEWNTGQVFLTSARRAEIQHKLGSWKKDADGKRYWKAMLPSTLSHSLKRLRGLNLIHGDGGDLIIDPRVHWKGTSDEREKMLKTGKFTTTIEFSFNIDESVPTEVKQIIKNGNAEIANY